MLKLIFKKCFQFLNYIVPKNNKLIVFASNPDFSDNTKVVYDFIKNDKRFLEYQLVWVYLKHKRDEYGVRRDSFAGLFYYLRAKYVFASHGLFLGTSVKKQTFFNLWHGMPLKSIGSYGIQFKTKKYHKQSEFTYTLATSPFYREIMAKVFAVDEKCVLVLGNPRNDLLLSPNKCVDKINFNKKKKLVFWLPTYRKPATESQEHCVMNEGFVSDLGISFWDTQTIHELDERLDKENVFLIIKLHPIQSFDPSVVPNLKNILFMTNQELLDKSIDLYSLLAYSSALITDYSSVYIDYLILNRPIAFVLEDFDEYKTKRGFVFDDPIDFMPGQHLKSKDDFYAFISNVALGLDHYESKRCAVKKKVNVFNDALNTSRVVNFVFENGK